MRFKMSSCVTIFTVKLKIKIFFLTISLTEIYLTKLREMSTCHTLDYRYQLFFFFLF